MFTVFIKLCTVLNVHLPPTNPEEISTVVFPENGDTQIIIPASAIIHQRNTEGRYICNQLNARMHLYTHSNITQNCIPR